MTDQTTVSGSDAGRQDEQPDSFHRALSTTQVVQGLDADVRDAARLGWCEHCGEGVTTFCRGALDPCPKGLTQAVAAGVRTPDGGQHGKPAPLTQEEAQVLAAKVCTEYLTACCIAAGPNEREHIGNYLMKLASVAGVVMAQAEGSEVAFDRLIGAAQFILNDMPRKPSRLERLQ